jgi:CheY-like chemotaxis protein
MIAVTARSAGSDKAGSRKAGMDDFLRKPVSGEQWVHALASIMTPTDAAETAIG